MTITELLLIVAVLAAVAWVALRVIQYQTKPKYKDCPWCNVTIRYRASICPNCAKFVFTDEAHNTDNKRVEKTTVETNKRAS